MSDEAISKPKAADRSHVANLWIKITGMNGKSWLNRTVLGIALASLFSDWSHEMATAILPTFLGSLGATAAWLGIIEGVSDGLSSFAKLGSGFYTDGLSRRKPIAFVGYLITTLATAAFGLATAPWHVLIHALQRGWDEEFARQCGRRC